MIDILQREAAYENNCQDNRMKKKKKEEVEIGITGKLI